MDKKHLFLAMALPAVFAACSNEEFVSDNISSNAQGKFVTLPSNFALVQDGEDAQTRGEWAINSENQGKFVWMPVSEDGSTYTPDRIGYAWTGVMHKADGTLDEVGSALTAYSDRVFTNYEFVHFAWRIYGEDLKQNPCSPYNWISGVEQLQDKYYDATWKKTEETLPTYKEKLGKGDIDITTGMFNTPNSTVYAGDYIVYAPYDNENVSNYIMASSKKTFKGKLYTKGGNVWEYNDIFIYGKSNLAEGGVQTTTFTTKNLNGYVFLTLKDKDETPDQIKKVILYDAKGRLLTKVGLSAKGIMEGKTGKDLYLADAVASRETTTTLTVDMVKEAEVYPKTTKDGSSVLIPVLPTEGALDNVEIIVINDANKAVRQNIESLTILPNKTTNVTVSNIDFTNAGVLVTDEASLRYETGNQDAKEGIDPGFNASDNGTAKTVELLGDIKLTTTLAIRGNYTLQGGKIIIPGNDGENVTGYGSKAEVRMVVHAKDAAKPAVIKSDIEVEAAGCCKTFGGSLIVGNAIIEGKVTTENQTVYAGSEDYVDGLSADKSKHGMVKFNVTGATTTFNGELVNNGRLDFGRSDRGANNTGTPAQLQVNVEKGSIINKNQMTIFRYEKSGQNASQLSPYVYVGNQGTFSNEGEFTIEGKWGMYGKGSNSGVIYDRVSSTVSGDLLNYNTADAKYVCDVNDPGNRFKDAVDGKSKPTTTVRFVEKSGTYDFETVTEESTSKKIVEYIVSLPTENTEENKTVTMKGDIKLSGKNIIVESGRLNFAQYTAGNSTVNSKLSVENLTIKNGGKVVIQNVSATVNKEMNVSGEAHVKDVKDFTIGKSGSKVGKLSVNAYKDNTNGSYDEGYINCNLNTVTTVYGDIVNNGLINIVEATGTASDIPAYLYYTGSVQANASNWAQGVASKISD